MKTTIDISAVLLKKIERLAAREGRKLNDVFKDLLRIGLSTVAEERATGVPVIATDEVTGFPVIVCKHAAPKGSELTPARVAEILLSQEVAWHLESALDSQAESPRRNKGRRVQR